MLSLASALYFGINVLPVLMKLVLGKRAVCIKSSVFIAVLFVLIKLASKLDPGKQVLVDHESLRKLKG